MVGNDLRCLTVNLIRHRDPLAIIFMTTTRFLAMVTALSVSICCQKATSSGDSEMLLPLEDSTSYPSGLWGHPVRRTFQFLGPDTISTTFHYQCIFLGNDGSVLVFFCRSEGSSSLALEGGIHSGRFLLEGDKILFDVPSFPDPSGGCLTLSHASIRPDGTLR